MQPSPACFDIIKRFEGCKLEAYPDPGSRGWSLPTIGYGHTGPDVRQGMKISAADALALLAADVEKFGRQVDAWLDEDNPITQNQFDALVSWAYNCAGWNSSSLLRYVMQGQIEKAADEFPKWIYSGKTTLPGLIARRAAERALFLSSGTQPRPGAGGGGGGDA